MIKLKIQSGEAKSGPYLAPILGQHQINLMEFCKIFNADSLKNYQQGTPLAVKIFKVKNLPLKIIIKGTTITSLFVNLLNRNSITIERLYDLYTILNTQVKHKSNNMKKAIAYSMFGSLSTMKKFDIIF